LTTSGFSGNSVNWNQPPLVLDEMTFAVFAKRSVYTSVLVASAVAVTLAASVVAATEISMSGNSRHPKADARVSVKRFGARGSARIARDGVMTAGSPLLVSENSHFSVDDVGKPVYVLDAGEAGAPLNTYIRSVSSASHAYLAAVAASTVTLADITIGVDDTSSIQNAITTIGKAGGGTVYIPVGFYRVARALKIEYSNIRLTGDGSNTVLFESDLVNYPDVHSPSATPPSPGNTLPGGWSAHRLIDVGIRYGAVAHVEIDHLQVRSNGNKWIHGSIGQSLIETSPTGDFAVEDFTLHDVTFTSKNVGLYSNGGRLNRFAITHNRMAEVAKEAIYLAGESSNGVVSENQISTDIYPSLSNIGIEIKNATGLQIANNTITGSFYACISAGGGSGHWPESNISVVKNSCLLANSPNVADGIVFDHGNNISIVGNLITGFRAYGIRFFGSDSEISGITISQNVVQRGNGGAAISVAGSPNGPANIAISNNSLVENDSVGGLIELSNITGKNVVYHNDIRASRKRRGNGFVISNRPGSTLSCNGNTVVNYGSGNLRCQ
jgi:polygalacturonase